MAIAYPRGDGLGLSSCTQPEADYKSALPGGMAWDYRVVLDPKPTTSRLSQGGWPGIVELYSTRSRLQVGSPRGGSSGIVELYSTRSRLQVGSPRGGSSGIVELYST